MRKRAFTLIEIMVVVALIGILATLGGVNYQKYVARSYQKEAGTNLRIAFAAGNAYIAEHGQGKPNFTQIGFKPQGKHRYTYFGRGEDQPGEAVFEGITATMAECGSIATADLPPPFNDEVAFGENPDIYFAVACANLDNDETLDAWVIYPDGLVQIFDDVVD